MKFENPEFQEIYEKSQPKIQEHKKKLDRITKDINQLESFLKNNVFVPYEMDIRCLEEEFKLIFKGGRIYHSRIQGENEEIKPLIETKVIYRLRSDSYLKMFLINCIENSQI